MKKSKMSGSFVPVLKAALVIGAMLLASDSAFASGSSDPLGDGICAVVLVLTGKWLFGFTILATIGAGAAVLFGGEMSDALKKTATIISIVGLILSTASILSMAFQHFSSSAC